MYTAPLGKSAGESTIGENTTRGKSESHVFRSLRLYIFHGPSSSSELACLENAALWLSEILRERRLQELQNSLAAVLTSQPGEENIKGQRQSRVVLHCNTLLMVLRLINRTTNSSTGCHTKIYRYVSVLIYIIFSLMVLFWGGGSPT